MEESLNHDNKMCFRSGCVFYEPKSRSTQFFSALSLIFPETLAQSYPSRK